MPMAIYGGNMVKYCLGTVQFGSQYGIQGNRQPLEREVFEMLNFAIDRGIEIFDTASAYGESEKILGAYIRSHPKMRKNINIVSKLKQDAFLLHDDNTWERIAIQNAEESIERLGINKLYAYLFHDATYIFNEIAVNALNAVKKEGLADMIGVSIYQPEEAMKALEYPFITAIQIPYNVFDQRLDACGFFEKAKAKGVMIFARSSLLQGLVVMNPEVLPSRMAFAEVYLRKLLDICDDYGVSPLEAAIGYVGGKKEIDYVVFGVDNINQLNEYISIRETVLPTSMVKRIQETFINVEERLVNPVLWK